MITQAREQSLGIFPSGVAPTVNCSYRKPLETRRYHITRHEMLSRGKVRVMGIPQDSHDVASAACEYIEKRLCEGIWERTQLCFEIRREYGLSESVTLGLIREVELQRYGQAGATF